MFQEMKCCAQKGVDPQGITQRVRSYVDFSCNQRWPAGGSLGNVQCLQDTVIRHSFELPSTKQRRQGDCRVTSRLPELACYTTGWRVKLTAADVHSLGYFDAQAILTKTYHLTVAMKQYLVRTCNQPLFN